MSWADNTHTHKNTAVDGSDLYLIYLSICLSLSIIRLSIYTYVIFLQHEELSARDVVLGAACDVLELPRVQVVVAPNLLELCGQTLRRVLHAAAKSSGKE